MEASATVRTAHATFTLSGESSRDFALRKLHSAGSTSLIVFFLRVAAVGFGAAATSLTSAITLPDDVRNRVVCAVESVAGGHGSRPAMPRRGAALIGRDGLTLPVRARITRSDD